MKTPIILQSISTAASLVSGRVLALIMNIIAYYFIPVKAGMQL